MRSLQKALILGGFSPIRRTAVSWSFVLSQSYGKPTTRSRKSSSSQSLNDQRPRTAASQRTHDRGARHPLRAPRCAAPAASEDLDAGNQATIAAQRQAFDYDAAERAEILREHEVLEALLMAHLKNEDEITKKWISLI